METNEWTRLGKLFALSPERELYVHNQICGIDPFILLYDNPSIIISFDDVEGCYIPIDNAIQWHLEESTYVSIDRMWHSVAATEFQRIIVKPEDI